MEKCWCHPLTILRVYNTANSLSSIALFCNRSLHSPGILFFRFAGPWRRMRHMYKYMWRVRCYPVHNIIIYLHGWYYYPSIVYFNFSFGRESASEFNVDTKFFKINQHLVHPRGTLFCPKVRYVRKFILNVDCVCTALHTCTLETERGQGENLDRNVILLTNAWHIWFAFLLKKSAFCDASRAHYPIYLLRKLIISASTGFKQKHFIYHLF